MIHVERRGFEPPRFEPPEPKIDTNSEQWRHECEVRMLENMEVGKRVRWLSDIEKKRGDAAVDRIMKSMSRWCLQEIADEAEAIKRERELAGILR